MTEGLNRLPCKGSWTRVHERTEGLKGIALFIQIPYTPKKSLRLALTATHLPLQGRHNPPTKSDDYNSKLRQAYRICI